MPKYRVTFHWLVSTYYEIETTDENKAVEAMLTGKVLTVAPAVRPRSRRPAAPRVKQSLDGWSSFIDEIDAVVNTRTLHHVDVKEVNDEPSRLPD